MDNYPQNLIEQYLKASSKLKKFDRVVFKRFAPNVSEVLNEFTRLALKFEEASIFQYAAMCHLGVAKCELSAGNGNVSECNAYLKAARSFLRANGATAVLQLRSNRGEYIDGALRCYTHALERCSDDAVLKAAIIREMTPLQPHYEGTSSFASPAHRLHELELGAHASLQKRDFRSALQQLDDIVDNISERKRHALYEDLLGRVEILRLLLLVVLNLPPARQSPSHIKLIEFYYQMGNFEQVEEGPSNSNSPGAYLPLQMKYALAEVVVAWCERKYGDLKLALEEFALEFKSLNEAQRFVLNCICENADRNC